MEGEKRIAELEAKLDRAAKQISGLVAREIEREDKVQRLEKDYNDLIYQVATKFPNESRHETAKRYIQQAENRPSQCSAALEKKDG